MAESKYFVDVFGDGPYRKNLERLVEAFNVVSNFKFKGSHANIKALYQNYDYLIQPTHMECFSLSILESLAANIPVSSAYTGDLSVQADMILNLDGVPNMEMNADEMSLLERVTLFEATKHSSGTQKTV